jgi:hypothetical protein
MRAERSCIMYMLYATVYADIYAVAHMQFISLKMNV